MFFLIESGFWIFNYHSRFKVEWFWDNFLIQEVLSWRVGSLRFALGRLVIGNGEGEEEDGCSGGERFGGLAKDAKENVNGGSYA